MSESKREYVFEYDEITCCSDCPLFYDMFTCELEDDERDYGEYTYWDDGYRPCFCKLGEVAS